MEKNKLIAPKGFQYKQISDTEIELVPIEQDLELLNVLNGNDFLKSNI